MTTIDGIIYNDIRWYKKLVSSRCSTRGSSKCISIILLLWTKFQTLKTSQFNLYLYVVCGIYMSYLDIHIGHLIAVLITQAHESARFNLKLELLNETRIQLFLWPPRFLLNKPNEKHISKMRPTKIIFQVMPLVHMCSRMAHSNRFKIETEMVYLSRA